MTLPQPASANQLITQILETYHERHRRDLPGLVRLVSGWRGQPADIELASRLAQMQPALELHMFMEEMRLFPMMSQGGHVLVQALVEDMAAEHELHAREVGVLRRLVDRACAEPCRAQAGIRLRQFLDDLDEHIALEEDVLFPMFCPPVGGTAELRPARA